MTEIDTSDQISALRGQLGATDQELAMGTIAILGIQRQAQVDSALQAVDDLEAVGSPHYPPEAVTLYEKKLQAARNALENVHRIMDEYLGLAQRVRDNTASSKQIGRLAKQHMHYLQSELERLEATQQTS